MHIDNLSLPALLFALITLISATTFLLAIILAPWRALLSVQTRQHAYLGGIICLVVTWSMKIGWIPGLILHPLGITAFTVVFGWPLTIVAGFVALIANTVLTHGQWSLISVDFLLTVLIPATVTYGISRLVLSHASRNLFLFLLGIGFVGAILGMLSSVLALLLLAYFVDHAEYLHKLRNEFAVLAMLLYTEGFLNGMVVAAITVFAPDLVKTFDNRKYLREK
ncbi:MAG TPA: energy-coupling factor ABC transporter permease [Gammaproteobacteria bacterium]